MKAAVFYGKAIKRITNIIMFSLTKPNAIWESILLLSHNKTVILKDNSPHDL